MNINNNKVEKKGSALSLCALVNLRALFNSQPFRDTRLTFPSLLRSPPLILLHKQSPCTTLLAPSPSPFLPSLLPSLAHPYELHHLPHQIVAQKSDPREKERAALSAVETADLANCPENGEAAADGEPVVLAPLDGGVEALGLSGGEECGAVGESFGVDVAVRRESGTDRGEARAERECG